MPGVSSSQRRTLLILVSGISIGFILTELYNVNHQSVKLGHEIEEARKRSRGFVPNSPHSHGEMDNVEGPAVEQRWDDEADESHHGESNDVATELKSKVKVLCWVMTNPNNHYTKARHIKATWGQRCNKLLFMSTSYDSSLPTIALNVSEGRDNLWGKTRAAFEYTYHHHINEYDWFLKADDDTYVVVENLRFLLKDQSPESPVYFGRRFKPYSPQGYMSGGAGYVLSRGAVKKFVKEAMYDESICHQQPDGAEDHEIGMCLQMVGVKAGDSRDSLGRERFHPFTPDLHLIPGSVEKSNWYWSYNYYPAKEGPECCSDFTITFHYVEPRLMYVMEYLIYHLRPYGVASSVTPRLPPSPHADVPNMKPSPNEVREGNLNLPSKAGGMGEKVVVEVEKDLNLEIKSIIKPLDEKVGSTVDRKRKNKRKKRFDDTDRDKWKR